jgi:hypothetical protein
LSSSRREARPGAINDVSLAAIAQAAATMLTIVSMASSSKRTSPSDTLPCSCNSRALHSKKTNGAQGIAVPVLHIHTYLVHPGKGVKDPNAVNGANVKLSGSMFNLLEGIYNRSEEECVLDIIFKPNNGVQQNDCRDLVCAYVANPTIDAGRAIAERLQTHTDRRPGLGLLFLIVGKETREHKVVLSRFPTDSAILVEENPKSLDDRF